jgi:hypothetical protein
LDDWVGLLRGHELELGLGDGVDLATGHSTTRSLLLLPLHLGRRRVKRRCEDLLRGRLCMDHLERSRVLRLLVPLSEVLVQRRVVEVLVSLLDCHEDLTVFVAEFGSF